MRSKTATTVSDQLRQAIAGSGLTHYRIGKDAGISPSVLDLFVRGERSLRLDTVDKIAAVLGYELRSAATAAGKVSGSDSCGSPLRGSSS